MIAIIEKMSDYWLRWFGPINFRSTRPTYRKIYTYINKAKMKRGKKKNDREKRETEKYNI